MKITILLFLIAISQGIGVQIQIWEYIRLKSKIMILSTWRSNLSYFLLLVSMVSFMYLIVELQENKILTHSFFYTFLFNYVLLPIFSGILLGFAPTFYAYQAYLEKEKLQN